MGTRKKIYIYIYWERERELSRLFLWTSNYESMRLTGTGGNLLNSLCSLHLGLDSGLRTQYYCKGIPWSTSIILISSYLNWGILNSILDHFSLKKILRWFIYTLKFENYWIRVFLFKLWKIYERDDRWKMSYNEFFQSFSKDLWNAMDWSFCWTPGTPWWTITGSLYSSDALFDLHSKWWSTMKGTKKGHSLLQHPFV